VPTEDAQIHVSTLMYSVSPSVNVLASTSLGDRCPIARFWNLGYTVAVHHPDLERQFSSQTGLR
jgi:hypothetical protein